MAKLSEMRSGVPTHGKRTAVRADKGRLCDAPACSTVLSTYNAGTSCWLHARPEYRHPLHRD
jgi:hypothetical protein